MCVDSLLLKFNSDEKQLTQLFISVFATDCILRPTNDDRPPDLWWWWALHVGIGMTINLPVFLCQWHSAN